jgi:NADH dehydrogenase (ubiquinone) flavoprotein 2
MILIKEDLTPEATSKILKSLKEGKPLTPGPVSGRKTCEPITGLTSLTAEPTGPGYGMKW